jgi:hypothetical protein
MEEKNWRQKRKRNKGTKGRTKLGIKNNGKTGGEKGSTSSYFFFFFFFAEIQLP